MKVEQTANTVKCKITELEQRFKEANDWANQTGFGVLKEQGKEAFDDALIGKLKYYFDLDLKFQSLNFFYLNKYS